MNSTTIKATVAPVPFGSFTIEGLLLEDGSFAIALQQVAILFSVLPNASQIWVKQRTGKGFQFYKVKTNRNEGTRQNRNENALSLNDFEKLLFEVTLEGNTAAIELSRSLVGLALQQLFSDAFKLKFDADDRQAYLKERQAGKKVRRTLTDAIKSYLERHDELSDNYRKFIYSNVSDSLNRALFGKTSKSLCEDKQCSKDDLRDNFTDKELQAINYREEHAMKLIDKMDAEPPEAMRQAIEFHA